MAADPDRTGALGLLLGGLFELAMVALAIYLAAGSGWFWLEAAFFVLVGVPTVVAGAMALYAHRRWPPARPAPPDPVEVAE